MPIVLSGTVDGIGRLKPDDGAVWAAALRGLGGKRVNVTVTRTSGGRTTAQNRLLWGTYTLAVAESPDWIELESGRPVFTRPEEVHALAKMTQDSYAAYAGNVSWMTWKYLGEKTILASFHSEHLPVKWGEGSGNYVHYDKWEPRDVWVVEGVSKLPQYAYGKRVIFLDKESYRIPYSDIYDQAGQLWKVWVNNFKYAQEPIPGAKYRFNWDVSYNPSITMVDMQLEHATHCSLPSDKFNDEQGWYINVGDKEGTTAEYFSLSSIIAAAR